MVSGHLAELEISAAQLTALDTLRREIEPRVGVQDPLALVDDEEALSSWLSTHGVDNDWLIAPPLAAAGVDIAWCERAATCSPAWSSRPPWSGRPARTPSRRCSPRRRSPPGASEIGGTGHAMPPQVAARAFEAFYPTKDVGKGTGLGLDIARRIVVERHRGAISIDSQPGRTVLAVRLPVRVLEPPGLSADGTAARAS